MNSVQASNCQAYAGTVHFDTYIEGWGRVVSDGEIIDVRGNTCLVLAFSIQANVTVPTRELCRI